MTLPHDAILAPDRTYPWFARWPGARPAKTNISGALRTLPNLGEPGKTYAVAVISRATDTTANGVIWPVAPLPVSSIAFELAQLGADLAGVDEWPEGFSGSVAKGYWDKLVGSGIESGRAIDDLEDGASAFVKTALLGLGLGLGVYLGLTSR